jgi:hypothetical protein
MLRKLLKIICWYKTFHLADLNISLDLRGTFEEPGVEPRPDKVCWLGELPLESSLSI